MKRILSLLFVLSFAFCLFACGKEPAVPTVSSNTEEKTETVLPVTDTALPDTTTAVPVQTDTETAPTSTETEKPLTEEEQKVLTAIKKGKPLLAVTDQKNKSLAILDAAAKDPAKAVLWEFNLEKENFPGFSKGKNLDEVKIRYIERYQGYVLLFTASDGLIGAVTFPQKQIVFTCASPVKGPHSIEMLPNGLLCVACSGNDNYNVSQVLIYRAFDRYDKALTKVKLPGAHGVQWDPDRKCLWALGQSEILKIKIGGSPDDDSAPTAQEQARYTLPKQGGHDMTPVYGNKDLLWISCSKVYQFNKETGEFQENYTDANLINRSSVKSVSSLPDGTVYQTIAKGDVSLSGDYNTDEITVIKDGQLSTIPLGDRHIYKCRAIRADYR